jgi:hypothetical protein
MNWTPESLERAVGKYLRFPDGSCRLLQKTNRGYIIGASRQPVSTKAALTHLNYQNVELADQKIHV